MLKKRRIGVILGIVFILFIVEFSNVITYEGQSEFDCDSENKVRSISRVSTEQIQKSIDMGVSWLASRQNWDGSWGDPYYKIGCTGLVLTKLEEYAYENDKSPFGTEFIYRNNVISGWKFLFSEVQNNTNCIHKLEISDQKHGQKWEDPDVRPNGYGLYFGTGNYYSYCTGICLMALASTGTPNRKVEGGLDFDNDNFTDTYFEIAQDTVDWIAFAQGDLNYSRGSWDYSYLNNSESTGDNSNSGYIVMGLAAAEEFGCTVPGWVRRELDFWINNIQDPVDSDSSGYDGGSYYRPGNKNINSLKTGNLIFEMTFYGDKTTSGRFIDAIDYIERHWHDEYSNQGWGYNCSIAEYHAMFCLMKGLEYSGINYLDLDGDDYTDHDWFNEFASVLIEQQNQNGSWNKDSWSDSNLILSTTWVLLTLEKVIPANPPSPPPGLPVADAGGPYIANEGEEILFNGSNSFDPDGDLLYYRWDFNGDGVWDRNWSINPNASFYFGDDWVGLAILEVQEATTYERFTHQDEALVTVKNVVPIIMTSENNTIFEGQIERLWAYIQDPGSDDLYIEWIWGCTNATNNYTEYLINDSVPDPYPSPDIYPRVILDIVSCNFSQCGTIKVIVMVKDDDGGTSIKDITMFVIKQEKDNGSKIEPPVEPPVEPPDMEPMNKPPIAKIKANPVIGIAPLKVYFTGSGSDEDGTIVSFKWDFGDGLTIKQNVKVPLNNTYNNPAHTFEKPGVYFVNLIVTDDDGANGSDVLTIIVNEKQKNVEEFCNISGYVYEAKTSNGISRANISVGPLWVLTSNSGFYSMEIPKGEHQINVDKGGYKSTSAIVIATGNVTKDFYLKPIIIPTKEIEYTRDFSILWVIVLIIIVSAIIISSLIARKKEQPKHDYYEEPIMYKPILKPRVTQAGTKPKAPKPMLAKQQLSKPKPAIIIGTPEKQLDGTKKTKTTQPTLAKPGSSQSTLAKLGTPQPTLAKPGTPQPTLAETAQKQNDLNIPKPTLAIPQPTLATPQPTLAIPQPTLVTPQPTLAEDT